MLFTRVLAPAIALLGLTAAATPTKRSNADVASIWSTLDSQTATILPQFGIVPAEYDIISTDLRMCLATLASSGNASDATVGPLITQLTTAINTAKTSISGLSPGILRRRQSNQD